MIFANNINSAFFLYEITGVWWKRDMREIKKLTIIQNSENRAFRVIKFKKPILIKQNIQKAYENI